MIGTLKWRNISTRIDTVVTLYLCDGFRTENLQHNLKIQNIILAEKRDKYGRFVAESNQPVFLFFARNNKIEKNHTMFSDHNSTKRLRRVRGLW